MSDSLKDIIVSGFDNFGLQKLTPWINSIERSGFTGDVLCIMYGNNPDMLNAAIELQKKPNFYIFGGTITKSVVCDRFKDYTTFLNKNKEKYRFVFATDAGDVVFQTNPSEFAKQKLTDNYEILCGSESVLYKDETWGNLNMHNSFPDHYEFMKNQIIYNAGTISGKINTVCDLFQDIYNMTITTENNGSDQAAYNILIQTKYKDVSYFSGIEDGYAVQCGTVASPRRLAEYGHLLLERPILKDGIAYNTKMQKTCLLHQYQNVPGFYQEVLNNYA